MDNNINNKTTPNQMRILMKRMRDGNNVCFDSKINETPRKDLNMRDMLKITRRLNEDDQNKALNKKTVYDQATEEEKMLNFFKEMNVNLKFIPLEVYDNLVFWGGTVDGVIRYVYTVTPDDSTSNVEFDYSEDFSPDDPKNDEIIKKLEEYYDIFSKYWQNNMIQR